MDPRAAGAKWLHSTAKGKVGIVTVMGQQSQSSNQNSMTQVDLWHWIVDQIIPRSEIDRSLLNFYLICVSKRVLG